MHIIDRKFQFFAFYALFILSTSHILFVCHLQLLPSFSGCDVFFISGSVAAINPNLVTFHYIKLFLLNVYVSFDLIFLRTIPFFSSFSSLFNCSSNKMHLTDYRFYLEDIRGSWVSIAQSFLATLFKFAYVFTKSQQELWKYCENSKQQKK